MKHIQGFVLFIVIGLFIGLIHEQNMFAVNSSKNNNNYRYKQRSQQSTPAKNKCRNRRRRFGWGFLGGGATGGLIAGVAGSAKWTPLGIVAGGLVGGAIGAATTKDCNNE